MVSKISDITTSDLAEYLRIGELDTAEENQLTTFLNVAKSFCESYTGIPLTSSKAGAETLDDIPDMVIAVYVLCQDMYDNRTMYIDKGAVNKTVQTILDMHTRNNIC